MSITKPMLADKAEDISEVKLPALVSDKLDGIRCIKVNGKALSRSFKPIPNPFVREWIEANLPDGIDGEIMLADGSDFNTIQSAIMKETGTPDFTFNAFDMVVDGDLKEQFISRFDTLDAWYDQIASIEAKERLRIVEHQMVMTIEALAEIELDAFNRGCEGIMLRKPDGPYKCGRSTVKEAYLLKYKRWVDEEATVLGFVEQMTNTNEKEVNELGNSKRSSKLEGKVAANTLGAFKVRRANGQEFEIGTGIGLTKALRQEIWDNQDKYKGKLVRFKHQVSPSDPEGMLPRFPSFQGFRHEDDL